MSTLATLTIVAALTATADVRALAADGDVLWIGTTGGLVRLEGETARVLTPLDGLPDGTVRALHIAGDSIWVGTDRGAARIDRQSARVEQRVPTEGQVRAFESWRGALWIGTWEGLLRLEPGSAEPEPVADVERITSVRAAGDLLYLTTAGNRVHLFDGVATQSLRSDRLSWDIAVRGDEAWVATSRGLRLYVDGRPRPRPAVRLSRQLEIADVRAVRFVDGRLVVGTFGGGLVGWTGSEWEPLEGQPSRLRHGRPQVLATGAEGSLLVGTPSGLVIRDATGWSEPRSPAGLPANDLSCLARTDEGLWVGTFRAGLALVRPSGEVEVWNEERGLVDDRINRLAVDHEGDLWIATERGVMERDSDGRFRFRGLLGEHVFVVATAGEQVYASVGADLVAWDGSAWRPVEDHPGRRVQDLTAAADGTVLSGTAEGLASGSGDGWSLLTSGPSGLRDDWVTAVAGWRGDVVTGTYNAGVSQITEAGVEPLRDDLWVNAGALATLPGVLAVGTLDQGLWLHDGSAWRTLTTADGLPDDDVTDVLPDGAGGLWVATRGGLAHLE